MEGATRPCNNSAEHAKNVEKEKFRGNQVPMARAATWEGCGHNGKVAAPLILLQGIFTLSIPARPSLLPACATGLLPGMIQLGNPDIPRMQRDIVH